MSERKRQARNLTFSKAEWEEIERSQEASSNRSVSAYLFESHRVRNAYGEEFEEMAEKMQLLDLILNKLSRIGSICLQLERKFLNG